MVDYKVLAQPSAIQSGDTRDNVYYPQIVNLSTLNTRGLIQAMMNMGSTAFSMGEYLGVASDLGAAIAQMLITGHKINLEGLGTFTPKVETSQKNVKEASSVNSSNFTCTVTFTPAEEFISILRSVVWNRVQSVDPGQSSSNAFTVTLTSPAPNTLKFVASKAGALQGFPAAGESISIDGVAVAAANIRYDATSGAIYVYNVAGGRHTIALTVGNSRGFEAYSNTWNNITVVNAASLISAMIANDDDEYDYLRISVNGGAAIEGTEAKTIAVEANQEVTLTMTAPNISGAEMYKVKFFGNPDTGDSNEGIEVYYNNEWSEAPQSWGELAQIGRNTTVTQKVRFSKAGSLHFKLQGSGNSSHGGGSSTPGGGGLEG